MGITAIETTTVVIIIVQSVLLQSVESFSSSCLDCMGRFEGTHHVSPTLQNQGWAWSWAARVCGQEQLGSRI